MFNLTRWAAAAAILSGAALVGTAASAAPVAGGVAAGAAAPIVENVQYYGYGRPHYGPRPGWRRHYGPPVVCRFRPTPYGPRRVCFRRF